MPPISKSYIRMHSLSSPYEDPNNYRVIRKICPSCGESSLVKKERKPTSHGFNPYSRAKSSSTDAKKESFENPNNAKERKESNDKLFTKVVPRSKSMAANSPHFRKKNEGTKSDHEKHHESNKFRSNERSKTDAPLPAREGKHQQKDDLRQRQKSQDLITSCISKRVKAIVVDIIVIEGKNFTIKRVSMP